MANKNLKTSFLKTSFQTAAINAWGDIVYFSFLLLFLLRSKRELFQIIFSKNCLIRTDWLTLVKIFFRRPQLIEISFLDKKLKLNVRDIADLTVILEIFLHHQYLLTAGARAKIVFDVGGHSGFFSLYTAAIWPTAKISCFEPDPDNFQNCLLNLKMNETLAKNISLFNFGFGEKNEEVKFYQFPFSAHNSRYRFYAPTLVVQIKLKSFSEYLDTIDRLDLLKIDVEGSEYEILYGLAAEKFRKIKKIFLEAHDLDEQKKNQTALFLFLKNFYQNVVQNRNLYQLSNDMVKKTASVSIIVLNYNGREFIKDCLDSVLQSDYPIFEIIVLDNASTDGSYQFLAKKYGQNSRVKILRSNNQLYFAGGNNFAAIRAQGEKLIFLNSDTVVDKNWLKELVSFSGENSKWLVQPKILFWDKKEMVDNVGGRYVFPGFGFGVARGQKDIGQYAKPAEINFANGTCFLIDKNLFEKLGGFDDWYHFHYEDVDLNLRAKRQGGQSWYCPKSVIFHKGSLTIKANVAKENLLFNIRKNRFRTIIKNFRGLEKIARLVSLLFIYLFFIIEDFLSFKKERMFLTLKSLLEVLNREHKLLIEKMRFSELKKEIGRNNFRLLDLGCGEAAFVEVAKNAGAFAVGVDQSPPPRPGLIASSIENFSTTQDFDAVTLFHVLEHTENPLKVLRIAAAFLKKGGVLVLEAPLVGNLTEKFLGKDYFAYQDPSHCHFFTKKEILGLIDKTGLKIKNKGFTLLAFPITVLTTAFRRNLVKGLLATLIFLPLKFLTILGFNEEIIRVYCKKYGQGK